jgi:hypothetical protein
MSDVNEFNADTNEIIIREFTIEEQEKYEEDQNVPSIEKFIVNENYELINSALEKLKDLGLTEEEAKKMTGIH